ncbi:glycosyltransferase family 8 protein [Sphingobacterium lactis]|uniref:Lipopolysaccharide biosynthesis protein, LPS:glycosyltransferase n=1 Tax=Sphingobacterium lactis TaxID=797291 RepID=A0A1H6CL48_9SPHI|nr:glycosyltransferase family 8 protein [Sphingobacterium lactis]SEG73433.1 Lipopolysaccharide biosynthesis protein, LPS:glycosyltransferase [Sphingobacterium lactis]
MKERIHLVVAFTENYFVPAATCITSILRNAENSHLFEVICLLTKDLPVHMKQLLEQIDPTRLSFRYINLDGQLAGVYVDERYTIAASFRLLLPELLKEYDKVIYLDCDIIVRQDLGQLYQQVDLGDNYLAAVFEAALPHQIEYLERIGCQPGYYFNSGFLLMNLALMRKDGLTQKLIDALKVPYLQFPDQDVLNILCQGRVHGLSPVYNSIRTFFLPQFKKEFVNRYSEKEWDLVQYSGTIHYTGGKPWNEFTIKFGEWWACYFKLPKALRAQWTPSPTVLRMGRIHSIPILNSFFLSVINTYRSIKNFIATRNE